MKYLLPALTYCTWSVARGLGIKEKIITEWEQNSCQPSGSLKNLLSKEVTVHWRPVYEADREDYWYDDEFEDDQTWRELWEQKVLNDL